MTVAILLGAPGAGKGTQAPLLSASLGVPVLGGVLDPSLAGLAIGGTGLLIVVSVVVETMKQIEAQLMMRNYEGFIR